MSEHGFHDHIDASHFDKALRQAMDNTTYGAFRNLQAELHRLTAHFLPYITWILNKITIGIHLLTRSKPMREMGLYSVTDTPPVDGWTHEDSADKQHYFVDGWSLCARTMGTFYVKDSAAPKCKVCQRSLEAKKRKGEPVRWAGA